ncbi:MAG: ABC transporter permease [bacterium]|nr:ABC transporter permease [bacterium]
MKELDAIVAIAYRDLLKFLRDRGRIIATFVFPIIFIGVLGGSLQANIGDDIGYNFLLFTFIGVIGQTLFQSTAAGIISLTEDREQDFSQEIFVSPISRYSIIIGKILGESIVAFLQVVGIILFGFVMQIPFDLIQLLQLLPVMILCCFFGGAFGILVVSNLGSGRSAREIFPFIIFPQFFLAGIFNPIKVLPFPLDILSLISPMRYAVDLLRGIYYAGSPVYDKVVLFPVWINMLVICATGLIFLVVGTYQFVSREQNR